MDSSERGTVGMPAAIAWQQDGLPAKIVTLRPASSRERAEAIRDVIDGFRQLRGSVHRFVLMFAAGTETPAVAEAGDAASLQPLLSTLARQLDTASFARRRELKRAIRDARRLEQRRDAIFFDTLSHDCDAMRRTAAELERIDATFVGLCVEHVLEQHRHAPAAPRPPLRRAPQTATVTAASPAAITAVETHADAPASP